MSYIYCFTNLVNGKKYIGSTVNEPNKRYNQHVYISNHPDNSKYNYPLYCAFRKYGIENFSYEVLKELSCDEIELRQIEQKYILDLNTIAPNGYNQTINTEHPINDPVTYAKIRNTKRENSQCIAELDDNNNIIKTWRSIVDCSEDTGLNEKKIASCCRGERLTTGQRRFCWITDENELDIKEYKRDPYKGDPGTTQIQSSSKKVSKLDDNDNIIATYATMALAARENNCDASGISKVCRGIRKKCGGFKWRYE